MASAKTAPATHSQPSRKGKKAWRKNVDITELQSGLDEARTELIHGGIISEKPSEELFVLDTTGSEEIKKKHLKKSKPLRADEIIAERASAVPALDSRKRKSTEIAKADKDKRPRTYVSHAEVQRLKARAGTTEALEHTTVSASHDPWAVQPKLQDPRYTFLKDEQPIREPDTLRQKPVSLAASGKPFAAVRRPESGKSYNPSFDEWQATIERAGAKEVTAETLRLQAEREDAERTAKALAEAAKPEPPSDEEYESAWESEWDGIKSDAEDNTWLSKKRPERKTQTERNKIKRRKQAEQQARHELRTKQRELRQEHNKAVGPGKAVAVVDPNESSEESGEEEILRRRPLGKNM